MSSNEHHGAAGRSSQLGIDSSDVFATATARGSNASTEAAIDGDGVAQYPAQAPHDGSEPGPAGLSARLGGRLGPTTTFATTEHFNLQAARALTGRDATVCLAGLKIYCTLVLGPKAAGDRAGRRSRGHQAATGGSSVAAAATIGPVLARCT